MHQSGPKPAVKKNKKQGIKSLLRELSDDDEDGSNTAPAPSDDASKPWRAEFRRYIDAVHELSEGMTTIKWWGVSHLFIQQNPVCINFTAVV
jgi:hypothetical protein